MRENIKHLCGDPLFQLNIAIWLSQPIPEYFFIKPVFYQAGLSIYSISPSLTLPIDIRLIISESHVNAQDCVKPDLVLKSDKKPRFVIVECKKSSFGKLSSTAEQSRTLMLLSGPILSEVLGGKISNITGILCYLTQFDQISPLERTLSELTDELKKVKLEPGKYGVLGIKPSDKYILLEYSDTLQSYLGLIEKSPVEVLAFDEETDPRPLYFIPYDPNISFSKEEQDFYKRILYERVLVYILSILGPAKIPCSFTITTIDVLTSVTLGVYEIWDDNEAKKNIRNLLKSFMQSLIGGLRDDLRPYIQYEPRKGWLFSIKTKNIYGEILAYLSKFKPENLDLSQDTEPELFE